MIEQYKRFSYVSFVAITIMEHLIPSKIMFLIFERHLKQTMLGNSYWNHYLHLWSGYFVVGDRAWLMKSVASHAIDGSKFILAITYPLVMTNSSRTGKWPIEIVDFPMKNMVLFHSYVNVYQRVSDIQISTASHSSEPLDVAGISQQGLIQLHRTWNVTLVNVYIAMENHHF